MRLVFPMLGALAFCACVKAEPVVNRAPEPVDAGLSEADLLAPKVDALEKEVLELVRASDEAVWKTWTLGAPLDLPTIARGHEALFTRDTLDVLRKARSLRPADAERIDVLTRWITGEALVRGLSAETEAITNLEASASFMLDGKELPWRDLGKILVSEKSALKRRSIWQASHDVASRLEALIARREQRAGEVLEGLGEPPSVLEYAARSRGFTLEALRTRAEDALAQTDDEWKRAVQALADVEVKLPAEGMSRGDFPRLLRVPAAIDAEFPRAKIATRLVQTLGTLGVYGQPGLTLDLAEAAKKNPLPITVAPTPNDVRMSIRPLGGLKDQQLALAELGSALALHAMAKEPAFKGRLAAPLAAQVSAERFASLLMDKAWLTANEVKDPDAVIALVKAHRLFAVRRAAGLVLARLEAARAADDAAARAAFVTVMTHALGVALTPEEGSRWRVETDDFLRSATQLEAMLRAAEAGSPLPH
jgi:hypothetical protein